MYMCAHVCAHTHTHKHTQKHAHTQSHKYSGPVTLQNRRVHNGDFPCAAWGRRGPRAASCTPTPSSMCLSMLACVHVRVYACTCTHTHTRNARTCLHIHMCKHINAHANRDTSTRAYRYVLNHMSLRTLGECTYADKGIQTDRQTGR